MTLPMSYLITIGPGAILNELLSWLVYLNRGTVLLQLLVGWRCDGRRTTRCTSAEHRTQAGS